LLERRRRVRLVLSFDIAFVSDSNRGRLPFRERLHDLPINRGTGDLGGGRILLGLDPANYLEAFEILSRQLGDSVALKVARLDYLGQRTELGVRVVDPAALGVLLVPRPWAGPIRYRGGWYYLGSDAYADS
jgi:hypothetical protein